MSKLARRFLFPCTVVLIAVLSLSVFLSGVLIEPYYIHLRKQELRTLGTELRQTDLPLSQWAEQVQESTGVLVVFTPDTGDLNDINERLRAAFLDRGLGLDRFWLWDEDYNRAVIGESPQRIYSQGRLNYSLLVQYQLRGGVLVALTMVIPNIADTVTLVNRLSIAIFGGATVLMILLLHHLVRRVVTPVQELGAFASNISKGQFGEISIDTGDELESLAESMNLMSRELAHSQGLLTEKNEEMKALLEQVSHDLKTPISLIKLYCRGIRDGMDDGTFLETIERQNEGMEQLVTRLLELTRRTQEERATEEVDLCVLLERTIAARKILLTRGGIELLCEIVPGQVLLANPEALSSLLDNLLMNAIKYTHNAQIRIRLRREGDSIALTLANAVAGDTTLDLRQIWNPFYVGERSRNKELSGTGLGLSIVRAICERYGFDYSCEIREGIFYIHIRFRPVCQTDVT